MDVCDLIAPGTIVGLVVLMIVGPLLFPAPYIIFMVVFFTITLALSLTHMVKFQLTLRKIRQQFKVLADPEALMSEQETAYYHVFVIPNYKEPVKLLQKTLGGLGSHRLAKENYIAVLAMEETEEGHLEKATKLKEEFQDQFREIVITCHPANLPDESRGKGSNVNHAARIAAKELCEKGYTLEEMIATVLDADSQVPEQYIYVLEKGLRDCEDPHGTIFIPFIFFSQNSLNVPAGVRITDIMWSIMIMQNLSNVRGMHFPCSTYTLSMALADRVGYWDTTINAIGEDMHMFLKCFFKTEGQIIGYPLFVPINQSNVECPGYLANLYARFVQAKRHYSGVADVAYAVRHSFGLHASSFKVWLNKVLVVFLVLEAHLLPAGIGWMMLAAVPLFQLFQPHAFEGDEVFGWIYFAAKIISALNGIPPALNLFCYEFLHRKIDKELFHKEGKDTRTIWNLLDYIWIPVSAFLFMTLPSTIAGLQRVFCSRQITYVVAAKGGDD